MVDLVLNMESENASPVKVLPFSQKGSVAKSSYLTIIINSSIFRIFLSLIVYLIFMAGNTYAIFSDNLTGNLSLSGVKSTTDLTDRSSLRREITGNWYKNFGKNLTVRSSLRYYKFEFDQSEQVELWKRELVPTVSLFYSNQEISASIEGRRRESTGTSVIDQLTNDSYDISIRTLWTKYPILSLRYNWNKLYGQPGVIGRNIRDQRLQFVAAYNWSQLNSTYRLTLGNTKNKVSLLETTQYQHLFRMSYTKTYFEDRRLRLGGNYNLSTRGQTDYLPGTDILLHQIPVSSGLFNLHDNASVGQLDGIPTLTDDNRDEPVDPPINIGTGMLPVGIGVDLGIARPINAIYVSTDRISDPTLGWRLYLSDDNYQWNLNTGNPEIRFDASINRYEIIFDSVITRYAKVVNSGFNQAAGVLVTEIQALVEVASERKVAQSQTAHFIDLSSNYRPTDKVTMVADVSYNREPSVGLSGQRDNLYHSASVRYKQTDAWQQMVHWQHSWQITQGIVQDTRNHSLTYGMDYKPVPTLGASASATGQISYIDGLQDNRYLRLHLRSFAEPVTGLTINAETGFSRVWQSLVERDTDTWSRRLTIDAVASRALILNGSYSHQNSSTVQTSITSTRDQYELGIRARLSRKISINGNISWSGGSIIYHTYDCGGNWSLTNSLNFGSQYHRTEGESGLLSERYSVRMNLKLSRRATLFVSYLNNDYTRMDGNSIETIQAGTRIGF